MRPLTRGPYGPPRAVFRPSLVLRYWRGVKARAAGRPHTDNPYRIGSESRDAWLCGWAGRPFRRAGTPRPEGGSHNIR